MKLRIFAAIAIFLGIAAGVVIRLRAQGQDQLQKITDSQRADTEVMLINLRDAVKKNYYDPAYHGLDIDARYKTYKEKLIKAETLGDAFRTVAAFLSGLDDPHTCFIPPTPIYQAQRAYKMQMFGDACFITHVRPESDAAKKLHPGDQVMTLDGFGINRKDLWQLEYYLYQLAPKRASEFTLRDPSGTVRKERVLTKYLEGRELWNLTTHIERQDLKSEMDNERSIWRNRYVEREDVMIWKMPQFLYLDSRIDYLIGLARKHATLILDLRGNPGGSMDVLEHMIGSFFDRDVQVAVRVGRKDKKPQMARTVGKNIFTGNLIVLVDSNSGSTAELFARVIQLEHRGTVLGDHSSGSVMEARFYRFSAGVNTLVSFGAFVTEADLIMSDGKSLEKTGVTPDEIILPTPSQLAGGEDPVLARAAELAGIKLDGLAAGKLFPYEWSPL
ncbi:MAG TPA: S41 family peptidase [Candidatus Acidoferrales bacterium]|nr:S41 family peptidase [Candidatus Acidoferrales bacterium]